MELLPFLRRTFSGFTTAERRKLGEKARNAGTARQALQAKEENLNKEAAQRVVPVIRLLLGLETK